MVDSFEYSYTIDTTSTDLMFSTVGDIIAVKIFASATDMLFDCVYSNYADNFYELQINATLLSQNFDTGKLLSIGL